MVFIRRIFLFSQRLTLGHSYIVLSPKWQNCPLLSLGEWFLGFVLENKISAGADGGPRSWVYAHLTLCSAPHWHQQKFFSTHSERGGKKWINFLAISGDSKHFSFKKKKKKIPHRFVHPKSYFFVWFKTPCTIS